MTPIDTATSNKIYIGVINQINELERISFSMTLNKIISHIDLSPIEPDLQNGIIINFDNIENTHPLALQVVDDFFEYIEKNNLYNDWMKNYTSISLYMLFQGIEKV
jgi:hypothetical protein